MKLVQIPNTRIDTQYVKFYGGLDLTSPVMSIQAGNALDAMNYEPGLQGGYKRIDGFERVDGRPAPSAATYTYLEGTLSGTIAPGNVVTGATSGATGIAIKVDTVMQSVCVTKLTGTFQKNEDIKVGAVVVGHINIAPSPRGYRDALDDATALAAAADLYRSDIGTVPGQGPVRGVWMYAGTLYAFRDAVGGASCAMYKATAGGWSAVPLGRELQVQQPSASVTTGGGVVIWNAHGLVAGALVQFAGSVPSGITAGTTYYVVNPTANNFQVAATVGGAAIAIGSVTIGLTCQPQAIRINEGDTITGATSGATAVVSRVALRTGAWSSYGMSGTLTMATVTGAFVSGEVLNVTGAPRVSTTSTDAAITLLPGGRFEFVTYNFTGSTDTRRMYGCDGMNPAFEFDGTVFMRIRTGMTLDTPKLIAAHKSQLFLTFKGSVQHSGDGLPYQWTVLSGANEIGIGDTITGMAVQPGNTLAIFARNSSWQLNGATTDTYTLLPISPETGALTYTVQTIGRTFGLHDRGVIVTDRTQAYGNFVQSTVSLQVQPLVDALRTKAIGSAIYRNRNQYRIYASDGSGIIATFSDQGLIGITQLQYPVNPTCFASCEDASGTAVVFFGADNGYVYQADRGSSFDGAAIQSYLRMPFNNISSPRFRKRFRKAVMDMSAAGAYASIRFQPEFSYGNPDVGTHRLQTGEVAGIGGHWDVNNWDQFFYDSRLVASPEFSIEGTGLNMALLFYSSSNIDLGHNLQGMNIHFSIRRLSR